MTKEEAYRTLLEIAAAFVDYELQTPEDYVADDGQPTTAAEVAECLTAEFTLAENPTVDDRCESNLKSGGSLKQERRTNFY